MRIEPTGPRFEPIPWRNIDVFETIADVQREYVHLGILRLGSSESRPTRDVIDRLRRDASRLGANAIVLDEVGPGGTAVGEGGEPPSGEWTGAATAIRLIDRRWGDRYWRYSPPPEPLEGPAGEARPGVGWRRMHAWSGVGDRDTESFSVPAGEWRVQWRATAPEDGELEILVYRLSDDALVARIDQDGGGTGSYLGLAGAGTFYLRVHGEGVSWEVAVDAWTSPPP